MDSPLAARDARCGSIIGSSTRAGGGARQSASTQPPPFFSRFERLAEIVGVDDAAAGRERYKFYRERGYELRAHDMRAGMSPTMPSARELSSKPTR